jgi:hypothetical protein
MSSWGKSCDTFPLCWQSEPIMSYLELRHRFPVYAYARWYCFACGFSVVPLMPQSKARAFKGNHFQEWLPCDEHLRKWFCTSKPYGIAIVPGEVSGNLVIVDFDELPIYQTWLSLVAGAGELPAVRSSRGVHVYVRVKTMLKNGDAAFEGQVFGQVIGHGNITAPPSVHPSGATYKWLGDPRRIPTIANIADLGIERQTPNQDQRVDRPVQKVPLRGLKTGSIRNPQAYVSAAIRQEVDKVRQTKKGARNRELFYAARKLAKYRSVVSEDLIIRELQSAAAAAGMTETDDSITPTIHSGFRQNTHEVRR